MSASGHLGTQHLMTEHASEHAQQPSDIVIHVFWILYAA